MTIVKNQRYRDSRSGRTVLTVAPHVDYRHGVRVWLGKDEMGFYGNYPVEFLEELQSQVDAASLASTEAQLS